MNVSQETGSGRKSCLLNLNRRGKAGDNIVERWQKVREKSFLCSAQDVTRSVDRGLKRVLVKSGKGQRYRKRCSEKQKR